MSFLFNGQRREWSTGLSVQQLLQQEGYGLVSAASTSVTAPEAMRNSLISLICFAFTVAGQRVSDHPVTAP